MRNVPLTVRPVGSYTGAGVAADIPIVNNDGGGILVTIEVTAIGTGSITVTIQSVNPVTSTKTTILASAIIAGNGVTTLKVAPGLPVSANASANDLVPRDLNINITHNNANPVTYSVGAELCAA